MAIGSVNALNRSVSAPEALRAPPQQQVRRGDMESSSVDALEKQAQARIEEQRRTSREGKDNGNTTQDLYQAPSVKQVAPQKPTGTLVNVTA